VLDNKQGTSAESTADVGRQRREVDVGEELRHARRVHRAEKLAWRAMLIG